MIKKIVIGVVIILVVTLVGIKIFTKSNDKNALEKIKENIPSYHSECSMKIFSNDEKRVFYVTVDYQKKDDAKDNYRISILDENVNQEQIMLKNKDGVFVLTPLLNQVYQFEGDYPLNSPKPYLYQSIISLLNGNSQVDKLKDGYLITSEVKYENYPSWKKEEAKLSKEGVPLWVNIYDSSSSLVCEITFTKVNFEVSFDDAFFSIEDNMTKSQSSVISSTKKGEETDLPLLPQGIGSEYQLKEQTVGKVEGNSVYILSYEGEKEFTLIQSVASISQDINIVKINGEYIEVYGGLSYIDNNHLKYIYNGVSYEIYSSSLSVEEMLLIATSMEVVVAK